MLTGAHIYVYVNDIYSGAHPHSVEAPLEHIDGGQHVVGQRPWLKPWVSEQKKQFDATAYPEGSCNAMGPI